MFLAAKVVASSEDIYTCGSSNFQFAGNFPYIVSTIILIIKIAVPILLIIFGMLDLGKAVVASKEEEIKKGQQLFIKRAISAVIVFFVIQVVQILVRFLAGNEPSIVQCFNCFVNGTVADNSCVAVDVE